MHKLVNGGARTCKPGVVFADGVPRYLIAASDELCPLSVSVQHYAALLDCLQEQQRRVALDPVEAGHVHFSAQRALQPHRELDRGVRAIFGERHKQVDVGGVGVLPASYGAVECREAYVRLRAQCPSQGAEQRPVVDRIATLLRCDGPRSASRSLAAYQSVRNGTAKRALINAQLESEFVQGGHGREGRRWYDRREEDKILCGRPILAG